MQQQNSKYNTTCLKKSAPGFNFTNLQADTWGRLNTKMPPYEYRYSLYKDKTAWRPYIIKEIFNTANMFFIKTEPWRKYVTL